LELRDEIDRLLAAGASAEAARRLCELWRSERGPAAAGFVISRYEQLRPALPLAPYRLAILRSFTVEPLVPLLRAAAFTAGIDLAAHVGEFNAYAQEILDPASALYGFAPDAVILAVQTRDVAPELWRDCAGLSADQRGAAVERVAGQFRAWVRAFRAHSPAQVILHTLEAPATPSQGVLDSQSEQSQSAAIAEINRELRRISAEQRGVSILDYDALVARHGREPWHDERKWLTVRLPIAARYLMELVREWMRFLHPLTGKVAKVLAVDLDNTLWGGVIGEDGMEGIQVGTEHPGAAYQALQRAMLDLHQRGILLAVCSKNNPDDALEALQTHPGMLLRPEHFAALRINWNDKAENLREIARELNLGLDAIAFLDDNPVERQHVREQAPEAIVLDLPPDAMGYAQALRDSPVFERLSLSEEDRQRTQYYAADRQRVELERSAGSREDFYRSLEQEAHLAPVSAATLARVAQLTQKTNQFNLTTRRYSEQQIAEMAACPGWQVLSLRVRDRYADNGLVGVAITRQNGGACEIDTFLLSCRVIGRTVETALLAYLAGQARARGATRLAGWFLPTKKNAPAREFYRSHGFRQVSENETGSLWELDLAQSTVTCPEWIRLVA
jgi:FkbH-like protein